MRKKIFIWWFPALMLLCSVSSNNLPCGGGFLKNTVENIYGNKLKIEKIQGNQKRNLIVTSGGTCHDCFTFVVDDAARSDDNWSLLYIVDGDGKLSVSAMRNIINSIKSTFGGNSGLIDDKQVYFLSKSRFCSELTKFPVILKVNKEFVPYEKVWNAMNEKGSVF